MSALVRDMQQTDLLSILQLEYLSEWFIAAIIMSTAFILIFISLITLIIHK